MVLFDNTILQVKVAPQGKERNIIDPCKRKTYLNKDRVGPNKGNNQQISQDLNKVKTTTTRMSLGPENNAHGKHGACLNRKSSKMSVCREEPVEQSTNYMY